MTDLSPIEDAEPTEQETPASGAEKPAGPGPIERIRRAFVGGETDNPKPKAKTANKPLAEPRISRPGERQSPVSDGATQWDGSGSLGDFLKGQDG